MSKYREVPEDELRVAVWESLARALGIDLDEEPENDLGIELNIEGWQPDE